MRRIHEAHAAPTASVAVETVGDEHAGVLKQSSARSQVSFWPRAMLRGSSDGSTTRTDIISVIQRRLREHTAHDSGLRRQRQRFSLLALVSFSIALIGSIVGVVIFTDSSTFVR